VRNNGSLVAYTYYIGLDNKGAGLKNPLPRRDYVVVAGSVLVG
jgi:hypothetical protein